MSQNKNENLSEVRLYELALESKHNKNVLREEINKFYTSLSSVIIPIVPLMDKFTSPLTFTLFNHQVNCLFIILPIIGIIISTNWIFVLKRLFNEILAIDNYLVHIEQKHNQEFIIFLDRFLKRSDAPQRITLQEMIVPYTFLVIFILALIIAFFGGNLKFSF